MRNIRTHTYAHKTQLYIHTPRHTCTVRGSYPSGSNHELSAAHIHNTTMYTYLHTYIRTYMHTCTVSKSKTNNYPEQNQHFNVQVSSRAQKIKNFCMSRWCPVHPEDNTVHRCFATASLTAAGNKPTFQCEEVSSRAQEIKRNLLD